MRTRVFFFLVGAVVFGLVLSPASFSAPEWKIGSPAAWTGLPDRIVPLLADLDHDGQAEAVVLQDGKCLVYRAVDSTFESEVTISLEGKRFTSAYAADLDRNGDVELVLGTDDLGYLVVYRWVDGPEFVSMSKHTWKPVANMVAVDVDGDGHKDVFAISPEGDVTLFRFSGSSLDPIWRGSRNLVDGRIFRTAQLNGQGPEEILMVDRARGGLTAYSWEKGLFTKVWESFPWGGVMDCLTGDVDGDGVVDILAISGRRLLYSFSTVKGAVVQKWKPVELPALCNFILYPLDSPDMVGLMSSSSQVLVFQLTKDGPVLSHRSEPIGRSLSAQMLRSNECLLLTQTGEVLSLTLYSQGRLDLLNGGRVQRLEPQARLVEGQPYVPAAAIASLLGVTYEWDVQSTGGRITSSLGTFAFALNSFEVTLPGDLPANMGAAPLRIDKDVYIPLELIELVCPGRVVWQVNRLVLIITNA